MSFNISSFGKTSTAHAYLRLFINTEDKNAATSLMLYALEEDMNIWNLTWGDAESGEFDDAKFLCARSVDQRSVGLWYEWNVTEYINERLGKYKCGNGSDRVNFMVKDQGIPSFGGLVKIGGLTGHEKPVLVFANEQHKAYDEDSYMIPIWDNYLCN